MVWPVMFGDISGALWHRAQFLFNSQAAKQYTAAAREHRGTCTCSCNVCFLSELDRGRECVHACVRLKY